MASPILLVLHIPKTGGTTLNKLVYANSVPPRGQIEAGYWANELLTYIPHGVYHVEGGFGHPIEQQDVREICAQIDVQRARLILGHFSYGLHRALGRPARYITLLRDPVERVASLYYHFLRFDDDPAAVQAKKTSLEQFARQKSARNDQTRRLSGLEPDSKTPSRALQSAMRNLTKDFLAVGLTERFDEFVLLLSCRLGWGKIHYLPRQVNRRRPSRSVLPPEEVQAIEDANELDRELYEFAGSMLDDAIREGGDAFAQELAHFRRENDEFIERHAWQPVDLNTAAPEALMSLPGIGPALAQRIVAYREQHDGFRSFDELGRVPGIGPARQVDLINLVVP